jgi:geranyl-CoA carboxylase alpha subunit
VGTIEGWSLPEGPGLRIDHGLAARAEVPPFYDSMIAKVIAHGSDREAARRRLVAALGRCSTPGLRTNRDYLIACLQAPAFVQAQLSTAWLGHAADAWRAPAPDARWLAVAAALALRWATRSYGPLACWSSTGRRVSPMRLGVAGAEHMLWVAYGEGGPVVVRTSPVAPPATAPAGGAPDPAPARSEAVEPAAVAVTVQDERDGAVSVIVDGLRTTVRALALPGGGWLDACGVSEGFADLTDRPRDSAGAAGGGSVVSRMHGQLVKLAVAPGQRVARGEFLLAIEAMKMEHRFEAPVGGIVTEVGVAAGAQVAPGRLLVLIEPDAGPPA